MFSLHVILIDIKTNAKNCKNVMSYPKSDIQTCGN